MDPRRWNQDEDSPPTERAVGRKLEARGRRVTPWGDPRGPRFPPHDHGVDEIDAVIADAFRLTVADGEAVLRAGDRTAVPRGVVPEAEVVGDETVVGLDPGRIA
jgi:quercetin dioxygenase-like cupin family protein